MNPLSHPHKHNLYDKHIVFEENSENSQIIVNLSIKWSWITVVAHLPLILNPKQLTALRPKMQVNYANKVLN